MENLIKSFLSQTGKNVLIVLILSALTLCAFLTRLENVKKSKLISIDEMVYYRMGAQLKNDIFNYNTIPYANDLSKQGRDLPEYFFDPLFKYPPLFSLLIMESINLFGQNFIEADPMNF